VREATKSAERALEMMREETHSEWRFVIFFVGVKRGPSAGARLSCSLYIPEGFLGVVGLCKT